MDCTKPSGAFLRVLCALCGPLLLCLSCKPSNEAIPGVRILGSRGNQPGQFSRPRAVCIDPKNRLVVVDRTGRLQTFDLDSGKLIAKVLLPEFARGTPTGMSLDPRDGSLWVADTHYQRILHYDADGTLLSKFGEVGTAPGQMIFPTDVCPDPTEDALWVTEYGEKNRLIRFKRDGTFVSEMAGPAYQEGELLRPMAVEMDKEGRLYVADAGNHRINVYSREGLLLDRIGKPGEGPGELKYPYDLALAPDGTLYVMEYGNNRVSHFTVKGEFLGSWGHAGLKPGEFYNPWGICVGPKGDLVAADTNNNRLQLVHDPAEVFVRPETPTL